MRNIQQVFLLALVGSVGLIACNSDKNAGSAPVSATEIPSAVENTEVENTTDDTKEEEVAVAVNDIDEAKFSVVLKAVVGGKESEIEMTVTNRSEDSARFCDYHTPFEGFRNSFLLVVDSKGAQLQYRGIMARRVPPTEEDYITLAPGESKQARFDLADAYTLAPGAYQVQFEASGVSKLPASEPIALTISR